MSSEQDDAKALDDVIRAITTALVQLDYTDALAALCGLTTTVFRRKVPPHLRIHILESYTNLLQLRVRNMR